MLRRFTTRSRGTGILAFALMFTAPLTARAQVVVIDAANGPGTDYTDLAGIAAASDGDTVLIRGGVYVGPLTVDGKGLTIVADGSGVTIFEPGLGATTVSNLAADQAVVLRGLKISSIGAVLTLSDNQGPVLIEDCTLEHTDFDFGANLRIENCDQVIVSGSDIYSASGYPVASEVLVDGSSAWFYDTELRGDSSLGATAGLTAVSSEIFLSGCAVSGGGGEDGAFFSPPPFCNGQRGGDALVMTASQATVLDTTLVPGAGGDPAPPFEPTCTAGVSGDALVLDASSSMTNPSGPALTAKTPSPVRSGEATTFDFEGEPSAILWFFVALDIGPPFANSLNFDGHVHLGGPPFARQGLGPIGASGTLSFSFPMPAFPGLDVVNVLLQPIQFSPTTGRLLVGTLSHISVLDPAF